ncbi:PAS domain S-box protein [Fibrisoma montanum]|uniref:histidine kinase n=1 Tax=Fibrisoma montanum TaxID=2305895 RepID=A0A418M1F4_9BACT|nr:ATP-binding protein [Fibrisoma montanum]RIV19497.1 PAS domain S-box protein [Fibrisoma montanum]
MTSEYLSFDQALKDRLFDTLIQHAPVAMALFYGPEFVITLANESVLSYWGRTREQVINKPLFDALPEASGQGFEALLTDVFTTGKRFVANELWVDLERNGQLERTYIDFVYEPFFEANPDTRVDHITGVTVVCSEVTEQVLSRQKIEESQAKLMASFEQSPVGIAIISSDKFIFRMANAFYQELVGRSRDQLIGQPLFEVLPELIGQGFDQLLNRVIASGISYTAHEVAVSLMRHEQSEMIYVDLMYQPQRNVWGHVSEILVVCSDVTQQVLARRKIEESETRYRTLSVELDQQVQLRTQELKAANYELTKSNQELTELNSLLVRSNENLQKFAFIASHDLQEPLRKIQSFADLLKTTYSDELGTGLDLLNRMQLAASWMSTLIRDLLSFSRIATMRDTSDWVSLSDIVGLALSDLDHAIEETDAILSIGPLPVVQGDPAQLNLLFQNLLSNALKFRRPGVAPHIAVKASWLAADHLPEGLKLSWEAIAYHRIDIVDNGIGFEEKYLDRIFQVFQRLHSRNEFAGTGIGLAICEKIVTNHGGAISATSRPGQGATFTIYLPI